MSEFAALPTSTTLAPLDTYPQAPPFVEDVIAWESPGFRERFVQSRVGRIVVGGLAAVGLAAGSAVAESAPVAADEAHTYTITGTDGEGVWLHGDPGLGDQNDLIKIMPEGTRFTADCYVNDTPVGPRSNPAWLYGTDETGATGYFADFYSSSRWSSGNTLRDQGLPFCGEETQPQQQDATPEQPENMIVAVPYDREAAVNWARTHAMDTPPYDASCTWFVSNALWAGGLPKDELWTNQGEFGRIQHRPGTKAAWAVEPFREYIISQYPQTKEITLDGRRFQGNAVPEASIGDVILYDWQNDGELDHASIVTDIAEGHYPEVAEWSVYDGHIPTPYAERGWTYSEKDNKWLQEKSSNVVAYLLDIDTTQTGEF